MKRETIPLPETFMVYDEAGRVWPPGFESVLCRPGAGITAAKAEALAAATAGSAAARAAGKGWSTGTIPHLVKPLMPQAKRVKVG